MACHLLSRAVFQMRFPTKDTLFIWPVRNRQFVVAAPHTHKIDASKIAQRGVSQLRGDPLVVGVGSACFCSKNDGIHEQSVSQFRRRLGESCRVDDSPGDASGGRFVSMRGVEWEAAATAAVLPRPIEGVFRVADRARREALVRIGRPMRSVLVSREYRVALLGGVGVLGALLFATACTLPLLAIGPIVFGVPHLVADARYLVVRPSLHRRPVLWVAIAILAVGLAAGWGVRAGLAAALAATLFSRTSWKRKCILASVACALLAVAQAAPLHADVAFAHVHNLIAVGFWLAWRRRRSRAHLIVLASCIIGSACILLGPLPHLTASLWTGLSPASLGRGLSWSADAVTTTRLVILFAFAQSVHYVIWLRLIPEEDRPSPTPRSYIQSARALFRDLGVWPIAVAAVVRAFLLAAAFVSVRFSRDTYLTLALAHGHLELIAAALLASGNRPKTSTLAPIR